MRIRVRIFEADAGLRALMAETLELEGISTAGHPGARNAAREVRLERSRGETDLVVADLGLRDDGGLELARALVRDGMEPDDIALVASAWLPVAYDRAREMGIRTFQKPFPISALVAWIRFREAAKRETGRVFAGWGSASAG